MKPTRVQISIATILVFGFLLMAGHGTLFAGEVEELVALSDKIKNETPGINLELWTEGDKTAYQISDGVVFGFTADKDCYMSLINIGTSGRMTLLFPNKWNTDNKVEKGKNYKIPSAEGEYAFKILGPVGTERIKAIASIDPIFQNAAALQEELKTPLEQNQPATGSGGAFLTMKNPRMVLKDIGFVLDKADPKRWATVELSFEVKAAPASSDAAVKPPSEAGTAAQDRK